MIGFVEPIISEGFVDQDVDSLIKRHIGEKRQLRDLSQKIGITLQPFFVSNKLGQDLKPKEIKPSLVNKQCVFHHFSCDLCDADYVGYTA